MANKPSPPPNAPDDGDDPFCLDFTKIAAKAKPAAAAPPPPPAAAPKAAPPPVAKAAPPKAAPPAPPAKPAAPAATASPSPSVSSPLRSARPANKPPMPPSAIASAPKPAPPAAPPPPPPKPVVAPAPAPDLEFEFDPEAAPPPRAAAPKVETAAPKAEAAAPKAPLGKLRQKLAARQAEQEKNAPAKAEAPAPAKPAAVPVAKPASPAPSSPLSLAPLEVPSELGLLDFVAPEPVAAAPMPAPSSFETPSPAFFLDDSAPLFQADELGTAPPPEKSPGEQLLEEVALLHAAGSSPDALSKLETALRAGNLGNATEQGWGVLFDLLQTLNRRQAFETLADAYAKRFEKSAPAWVDADDSADAAETAGAAQVALSGTLSAASESALKKLVEISQKNPTVHLNLVKVTDADNDGCRLLLDTLRVFKKNKRECLIVGAEEFVSMLASKIEMMQREREETWLLLLELSQQAGKQEYFEDIAVGYAVTFEVSPPSWEEIKPSKKSGAALPPQKAKDPMVLEGELLIGMGAIAALASAAKGKDAITIEIDRLQRIDAASAHALLTELTPLAAHGMHIRIRGVSMLIATLFHIVGIDQIATIEIRRR